MITYPVITYWRGTPLTELTDSELVAAHDQLFDSLLEQVYPNTHLLERVYGEIFRRSDAAKDLMDIRDLVSRVMLEYDKK